MRFEGYRNKAVVIETPIEHQELIENNIDTEPIVSESEPEIETTSDTTEEVSIPSLPESNEDVAELPKEEATPSIINNTSIENPASQQNTRFTVLTLWLKRTSIERKIR